MSLLQATMTPSRLQSNAEEETEKEELIFANGKDDEAKETEMAVEKMDKEEREQQKHVRMKGKTRASVTNQSSDNSGTTSGAAAAHAMGVTSGTSLPAGEQPVRGGLPFRTATLKLNHTAGNNIDDKTSRGLQPASPSQVLSRSPSFDANCTTKGRMRNMWRGLLQLHASLYYRATLALQYVTATSVRSGDIASWVLSAALILTAVLVCVCIGGQGKGGQEGTNTVSSGSRNRGGTIWKGGFPSPHCVHDRFSASREAPFMPQAAPALPAPMMRSSIMMRSSVGSAGAWTLPASARELASTSALLPRASCHGEADAYLCQHLVVPQDCESILRVPINPMSSFHVTDVEGNPVLRVELKVDKTHLRERRRVVLMADDGEVLAQCVATSDNSKSNEFQLLHANNENFAKLLPVRREEVPNHPSHHERPEAWTVRTCTGAAEWFLYGQFGCYAVDVMDVNVMDSQGMMLAWAQQDAPSWMKDQHRSAGKTHYFLRVISPMDLSIVLCSLLAINHLVSL